MRLIITRHGETIENTKGILMGHLHGKLTKLGIEQAKRLAKGLKDEKIDFIYSSDLARAVDTTKEIIKFHPKVPVKYVKELRERNLGEFQGKKIDDLHKKFTKKEWIAKFIQPKKGEARQQLYNRAKNFLYKILHKHTNKTILFVGHNGIDLAIICVITNKPSEEIPKMESLKNTSINIFEINQDKNYKIHVFNCIKHLA